MEGGDIMAIITLAPNESFEHYHSGASTTIHIAGDIEISFGDTRRRMAAGEAIAVPRDAPHTLTNVGTGMASIACVGPGGGHHAPEANAPNRC